MFWWCVHVGFVICSYSLSRAEVVLDSDGGFTNLVVGIHPDVPEGKIRTVLSELEFLFKNASRVLHTATRGQTYFKEVVFAVPKRYRTAVSSLSPTSLSGCFKRPEVILTSEDALAEPYALQHRGCGKQGLRIHVPQAFLQSTNSNKAKSLVREWAKYRYGVFDESGLVGDELYPACYTVPGSDVAQVTDCTNEKATYHSRKPTGRFPLPCDRTPIAGKNNHIVSSLMNKIDFPGVTQFCDGEKFPHNKNAPSKQNALCRKQSTWKIISGHNDFRIKGKRKSKLETDTKFKYVIEPDIRLILAVDTSNEMNEHDRLDMVQNAFSYFTLFNLPENSVVGLKDLRKPDKKTVLVTVNTPADAEMLIDAFPETGGRGEVCVECGIEKAMQELKRNSEAPQGQIVLISASDVPEKNVPSLESKLGKSDVSLHVLYFNKRLRNPPLLQKLCAASGGQFHYVPDTEGTLNVLYEAFRSIYESSSWMNRNHVLVNQRAYSHNSCSTCNISFQSDQSMDNFQVLLTGPRFFDGPPVVKDKTILSNGNQEFAPGHSSYSYKRKIPAYVFTIKNPKPGSWSLTFERKPGFNKPLVVIVRSSATKHNSIARMSSWMNYEENPKGHVLQQPPVALYSEVKMKHFPVANVSVSAILYNSNSDDEVTLKLFDVGDGDPDVTKNDGIFSKYFTESTKSGYYLLTMVAESEYQADQLGNSTQGEANPPALAYQMAPFQRIVTLGSFYLPPEDVAVLFPPRRISDLRVRAVTTSEENSEVAYELKWTSPGDNYDSGMVSDYQLRVFVDPVAAEGSFDTGYTQKVDDFNIHGQMLTRSTLSGSAQSAIVQLRNLSSGTYYFAMRTVNAEDKLSDVSNVVEIWYNQPAPPPTGHPLTDQDGSTISIITSTDSDQPLTMASGLGLALGLTLGILLFLIVVGCILYLYFRRRRAQDKECRKDVAQAAGHKSESRDVLYQSTNALNVSVISPVSSWPADSLISHYESVRKDKNSEDSEDSAVPKDASDTASLASSYTNRADRNSSVYDAVYFNAQSRDDVMSYPYNPGFNPIYTSSLRKIHEDGKVGNGYSPHCSLLDTSMLDGRGSLNPVYVSSLPRPRALERVLADYSPSNTSYSSYTLDGRGTLRLGTDV